MELQKSCIQESTHYSTTSSTDGQTYTTCATAQSIKLDLQSAKLHIQNSIWHTCRADPQGLSFVVKDIITLSSSAAMHRSAESSWTPGRFSTVDE